MQVSPRWTLLLIENLLDRKMGQSAPSQLDMNYVRHAELVISYCLLAS